MSEKDIKITATSKEGFEAVETKLKELPKAVLKNVAEAEQIHSYLHCKLKNSYSNPPQYILPSQDLNNMEVHEEGFIFYSGNYRFSGSKSKGEIIKFQFVK